MQSTAQTGQCRGWRSGGLTLGRSHIQRNPALLARRPVAATDWAGWHGGPDCPRGLCSMARRGFQVRVQVQARPPVPRSGLMLFGPGLFRALVCGVLYRPAD